MYVVSRNTLPDVQCTNTTTNTNTKFKDALIGPYYYLIIKINEIKLKLIKDYYYYGRDAFHETKCLYFLSRRNY